MPLGSSKNSWRRAEEGRIREAKQCEPAEKAEENERRENSLLGPEKNSASLYGPRKRNFFI